MKSNWKRKALAGVIAMTTAVATAVPAFAAESDEPKPLSVYVGGERLEFETQPLLVEGTTLVQFRPIFEKLGFKVDWDGETRTVTGTKEGLEIVLTIGSDVAKVNGKEVKLEQAARIENDTTLVPLRMVGETADQQVNWIGYERRVDIGDLEHVLGSLYDLHIQYTEDEDKAGVLSTIAESSPVYAEASVLFGRTFALTDMDYEVVDFKLLGAEGNQAVAEAVTLAKKVQGPDELADQQVTQRHVFVNESGSWKLVNSVTVAVDFLNADLYEDKKPSVPAAEAQAIKNFLEQFRIASEKEDWAAYESMYHDEYPNKETLFAQAKQLGALMDLQFEYSDISIIRYEDGEAWVRLHQFSKLTGGQRLIPDFHLDTVYKLKKNAAGEWKLAEDIDLHVQYLVD